MGTMFIALVIFIALVPSIHAQEILTPEDVVRRALQADPAIRQTAIQTGRAQDEYDLALRQTRPELELELRPYTRDQRVPPGALGAPTERVTESLGLGLQLRQRVPTSGVLSAGIDFSAERITLGDTEEWRQIPEVSLSLMQPLMGGNQFIGTRVFQSTLRIQEIGFELAQLRNRQTRNQTIQESLELFVRVRDLRNSRDLLEETIAVLERQIQSAELDRQQGLITSTAVLALQVALNTQRDNLFNTELQLTRQEQVLARSVGLPSITDVMLADQLPENLVFHDHTAQTTTELLAAIQNNPRVHTSGLAVEQAERRQVINSAADRPAVALFARARPTYEEGGQAARATTSEAFQDLFTDGSRVESTIGVTVTIPLLTGRQRELRQRIDQQQVEEAGIQRDDTEQILANQLRTLLTSRQFLLQRLELLEADLELQRQRTENERTLVEAGVSTDLRLSEVQLDLRSRINEERRVMGELFLNTLEIFSVIGEDLALLLGM